MAIEQSPGTVSPAELGETVLRAFDAHREGILVVADGRMIYWNGRFAEMWGIPDDVLATGSDDAALLAVRDRLVDPEAFFARVAELYGRPEAQARDTIALLDGRVFDRYSTPIRGGTGSVDARVWFFRDVTDERRNEERARFLAEAGELLAGSLDDDRLAESLVTAAVPTLADWSAVDLLEDDDAFHRAGAAHVDPAGRDLLWELDRHFPIRPDEGRLRGRVVATGRPVVLYDVDDATLRSVARNADHAEMLGRLGIRSAIWLPLQARGHLFGVMSYGVGTSRRSYGPADLALGEELARRAAMALDNAHAYRQLRDREQQAAVVASLGRAAVAGMELEALFGLAVERLAAAFRLEYAKILELQPDGAALRLVAGVGWRDGLTGTATVGSDRDSQAGYTLLSGGPIVVEDLPSESRFGGPALLVEHGVRSGMSVVIEGHDRPWGVLGVHTTRRRRFTPDDVNFLQSVANALAEAIEGRRAQQALRDRDDRLELTLASSRTGTWEWDVAGGKLVWSEQISRLHGLEPGTAPRDLDEYESWIHPDDRERFHREVERAVHDGSAFDLEYRLVWPDGSVHWTNGVGRVFSDESGRPVRMLGLGRDITDRKRAEEERDALLEAERQANALRDAFIGVVSHELRTPITTIYGGLKILVRDSPAIAEADRRTLLADVEAEADHLRRLVEDLLVLTRAERGTIELGDEPVQLSHTIQRVVADEAARWPSLSFHVGPIVALPVARGDETSIEQVLRNLLGNAAKYGPPDGTIRVNTDADADEIRIRVQDDGPGLAPGETPRLFQLFYRSPATSRRVGGAGIGLFVARRLVEAMGGRIWAEPRDGGGSEFGFALRPYRVDGGD